MSYFYRVTDSTKQTRIVVQQVQWNDAVQNRLRSRGFTVEPIDSERSDLDFLQTESDLARQARFSFKNTKLSAWLRSARQALPKARA